MSKSPSLDPENHHIDFVAEVEAGKDPSLERVWRKLDLYVVPVVALCYLFSFLDRTNLGNARVAGLQRDLKMTNGQYSMALTVTFIPYIFAELPSNLLIKAVGPNRLLPTLLTLWGVVTTTQGAITSYKGLLICRFFIGLLEGGVFPGLVLYLSSFYPRHMLNWRIAGFFSTASLSGAFSGILAYGIIQLDGCRGIHGWGWIFIIEGAFTVAYGLSAYFLLPRTPESCWFLTSAERNYVVKRLRETGATGDENTDKFSWVEVGRAFMLPQVQILAIAFFFDGSVLLSLAYFTPSIIQGLGYTAAHAQLFSVPPFAVAFLVSMTCAYVSDRYRCRALIAIFCGVFCAAGFGLFLLPVLATWSANNTAPHHRRATALAISFIMTNCGGIFVTWLYGTLSTPPLYRKASITMIIFSILLILFVILNMSYLVWQNKKKAAIRQTMLRTHEKPGLGDKSAWFIYQL